MTKGELKKALEENNLPDDSEVFIAVEHREGEYIWYDIGFVDGTDNGAPILIELAEPIIKKKG